MTSAWWTNRSTILAGAGVAEQRNEWMVTRRYMSVVLLSDWAEVGESRTRLVVFCEVKARTSTNPRKAARIHRCAAAWLARHRPGRVEVRFDVVSAIVRGNQVDLTHIPAAF